MFTVTAMRWNTAYASAASIRSYEVRAGEKVLLSLPYRPQLTEEPFKATIAAAEAGSGPITVVASTAQPRARGSLGRPRPPRQRLGSW